MYKMSICVAYGYCTNLTEKEKFEIDKQVEENLKFLLGRKIIKIRFRKEKVFLTLKEKLNSQKTKIVLPAVLFFTILLSCPTDTKAVGLPTPVSSAPDIQRLYPPGQGSVLSTAPIIFPRVDKIRFRKVPELPLCIYVMDKNFLVRPEISKIIREMRGGSWATALIGNTICLAVIYGIWLLGQGAEGFVQPPNQGWGLPNNLYEPPGLVRPVGCGTELYAGSYSQKTEADRNQPHPKDKWILLESRPELVVRRGQAQFKTKDHGALAGLPYKIKKNGGTSTARTEENIDRFTDVVEEIVENPNSIWIEEGTYQGGTDREVESINIFNEEEKRVAVFKRSTGEFMTFCEPTENERKDLLETGNFGGGDGWFSGQAKNFPPEQNVAEEMTPIDSFESQVMGMSPASDFSSIDEVQNSGFTPLTSFESDVMGITPLDSSSSDYQI